MKDGRFIVPVLLDRVVSWVYFRQRRVGPSALGQKVVYRSSTGPDSKTGR